VTEAPRDSEPVDDEADALAEQADQATGEIPDEQPEPAPQETAPVETEPLCTPEQQKAVQDALQAAGYAGKVKIITRVSDFVKRPVASSKELTETEAVELAAALWEEADANTPAA
jgi:hypothetical protein